MNERADVDGPRLLSGPTGTATTASGLFQCRMEQNVSWKPVLKNSSGALISCLHTLAEALG